MADHFIDIVNEKDEVVGKELKSRKEKMGFISRVVAIIVKNSEGKIIICKRSLKKENDPGKFDLSACGNVDAGENYEEAAERELMEETGIKAPLILLDKAYVENIHRGIKFKYFVKIFLVNSDDEPKLNNEVVLFRKITPEDLEKEMAEDPEAFCQGFKKDFQRVKNQLTRHIN